MARIPPPAKPRRYTVTVPGRVVAEIRLTPEGDIVPGSVLWVCDPRGVTGPDRERSVADLVRKAKLDPKDDHERLYAAIWGKAPKRE